MRLLFNRLRLTTTLEIERGETILDAEVLRRRWQKRFKPLMDKGIIEAYVDFTQQLFEQFSIIGPSERQRYLLAIGVPSWPQIIVRKRGIRDIFRGVAAYVVFPSESEVIDPRMNLALMAKVALAVGIPIENLDEVYINEMLKNLRLIQKSPDGTIQIPVYMRLDSKLVHSFEFGALLRNADGQLVLGLTSPEKLTVATEAQKLEVSLRDVLLKPEIALSSSEVDSMILRWQILKRQLPLWSRMRLENLAGFWPLEDFPVDDGDTKGRRVFKLPLQISDDSMEAMVKAPLECQGCRGAQMPTVTELESAIRNYHIKIVEPEMMAHLLAEIAAGKSLVGQVVARGQPSSPSSRPYLRMAMIREQFKPMDPDSTDNPRLRLPKKFVQNNELVAVVEYEEKAKVGMDVLGRELTVGSPEGDAFSAGEGVIRRGNAFYATRAGSIKTEKNLISVQKSIQLSGDIDASRGDLMIPGAAVIDGNIDHGVSIDARGALKITQSFSGRYLRVLGSLEIEGGIVGDKDTTVIVMGDLRAKFIQGGRVRCTGHVTIDNHVSGGIIEAEGNVSVLGKEGGIFGGSIVAGGSVLASNLGRSGGAQPQVWFGTSAKKWRTQSILELRLSNLIEARQLLLRQGYVSAVTDTSIRSPNSVALERRSRRAARADAAERLLRIEDLMTRVEFRLKKLRTKLEDFLAPIQGGVSIAVTGIAQSDLKMCREDVCTVLEAPIASIEVISRKEHVIVQPLETHEKSHSKT